MSPARRLWAYLLRYRGRYAVGILFLIAATGISLCIPWTIKNAIDAIRHEGGASLPRYVGIILLLAAANGAARMGSRFAMLGAGQWVERDIRDDLFAHLLTMPPAFYHAHRVGDLMSRASSDVSAVRQLAGFGTVMMSGTALAFVGTLTAMWLIDPWLTAYALAPFPLLVLIAQAVHPPGRDPFHRGAGAARRAVGEDSGEPRRDRRGARLYRGGARDRRLRPAERRVPPP